MKKLLIIWFCTVSIVANATNYYVAPEGSDAAAGTIGAPWATLDRAFDTALAGDTVFFRGGTYYPTSESQLGYLAHSGTAGSPICFFNYPGETPIIDCINVTSDSFTYGIYSYSKNYIEVKGLTIRNLFQAHSDDVVQAMEFTYGAFVRIENCIAHDINGVAFGVHGIDTTYIINCDAYNLCDSLQPTVPGQNGTGFAIGTGRSWGVPRMYSSYALIQGCRAWNASDQGFASGGVGYMEFDNCWSWNNGLLYGDGLGFKYSISTSGDTINPLSTYIHNCISADNGMAGFTPNNLNGTVFNGHYYNNFSYHNGYKPDLENYNPTFGYGFFILNYSDAFVAPHEMFSNNISYANQRGNIYVGDIYNHEYNSWDIPITVTAGDFVSLDTAELRTARNADNSLPTINFGRLVEGSDLIDAGTDVGLAYTGSAPDLGWAEYGSSRIVKYRGLILKL